MMAAERDMIQTIRSPGSRKHQGSRAKKRLYAHRKTESINWTGRKNRKLYKKRVQEYNSDDDISVAGGSDGRTPNIDQDDGSTSGEEVAAALNGDEKLRESDTKGNIISEGPKFADGCNAFRIAYMKIMKSKVSDEALGPVLSSRRWLIAEKLGEEGANHKLKGWAKKEKQLMGEKGHVKPASFLDTKEKWLIGVATKGVVKLFNAVSKAQSAQKGFNPSHSKAAKMLVKQKKETFLSELRKPLMQKDTGHSSNSKDLTPMNMENKSGLGWAPLSDNYFLRDSKLRKWDNIEDPTSPDIADEVAVDSSSNEE